MPHKSSLKSLREIASSYAIFPMTSVSTKLINPGMNVPFQVTQLAPPQFQRNVVWIEYQKQLYVDSHFKGIAASLILNANIDSCLENAIAKSNKADIAIFQDMKRQDFKHAVIDGQNRLHAICEYLNDGFRTSFNGKIGGEGEDVYIDNKRFSELEIHIRERILNLQVMLLTIESMSMAQLKEIFCRQNEGTPLNRQEKRNAMNTPFADCIRDLGTKYDSLGWAVLKTDKKMSRMIWDENICMLAMALEDVDAKMTPASIDRYYEKGLNQDDLSVSYDKELLTDRITNILDMVLKSFRANMKQFARPRDWWWLCMAIDSYEKSGYFITNAEGFRIDLNKHIQKLARQSKVKLAQDEQDLEAKRRESPQINFPDINVDGYFHKRFGRTNKFEYRRKTLNDILDQFKTSHCKAYGVI